ncbi:unnamed protein product [Prorocentrum cordatum]|uniref:Uncharacterized protein n=1 Tax=Prorocentrum cordatum TaxID=2364126 RepID=A0ABN9TQL9_9DINO|nr:unnamed protein product [Polarella glacialis]
MSLSRALSSAAAAAPSSPLGWWHECTCRPAAVEQGQGRLSFVEPEDAEQGQGHLSFVEPEDAEELDDLDGGPAEHAHASFLHSSSIQGLCPAGAGEVAQGRPALEPAGGGGRAGGPARGRGGPGRLGEGPVEEAPGRWRGGGGGLRGGGRRLRARLRGR